MAISTTQGPLYMTMTISQLQSAAAASTLVRGRQIFVTDACDLGMWVEASSPSTISPSATGLFQDAVWSGQTASDSSDASFITSASPSIFDGQWHISKEVFTVAYSTLVGGNFMPGDIVTNLANSSQLTVVSDNGVDSFDCYLLTAGASKPGGGTVLQCGGVTANGDSSTNPSIFKIVYCWMDPLNPGDGTQMYLALDESAMDGRDPVANPAAYVKMDRKAFIIETTNMFFARNAILSTGTGWTGVVTCEISPGMVAVYTTSAGFSLQMGDPITDGMLSGSVTSVGNSNLKIGYIESACDVQFDLGNGAIIRREQNGTEYTCLYTVQQSIGYNPIQAYPWGNPLWVLNRMDNARIGFENSLGSVTRCSIGINAAVGLGKTIGGSAILNCARFEANSIAGFDLADGVQVNSLNVLDGIQWENKTITVSFDNATVSESDTTTESVTYAPFTNKGLRRFVKVFTVADLTTPGGLDATPGLLFFTTPSGTLPVGTVYLQYTYAGAAFALASDLVLRIDNGGNGNIAGRYSNGLLTAASDRQVSLPFPQLTGGTSSKAMESSWGTDIYLSTFTGTVLATGGGTSTLTVILEYTSSTMI